MTFHKQQLIHAKKLKLITKFTTDTILQQQLNNLQLQTKFCEPLFQNHQLFYYSQVLKSMSNSKSKGDKNTCPSNQEKDYESEEIAFLPFELLTLNDRKTSFNDTELHPLEKQVDCSLLSSHKDMLVTLHLKDSLKKNKIIHKHDKKIEEQKKINITRKRKIGLLQSRIEQLEREITSLRRNQHYCHMCRNRLPDYYREQIEQIIQPQQPAPNGAGDLETKKHSRDSIEFQKIDFHTPLMQTREMEQKIWIFVGTMLIAMGSKVMDFDGTINVFKVLKHSVDKIRRQVQKSQTKLGMQFFCCKEDIHQPNTFIDGMNFDPFYSNKQDNGLGNFSLEGIKLQCVEEYELFYDSKYSFNIKYDALLTIMEYARDHCSIS